MNEKKAKPDFDKIVKVILLAMIALCLIALVVTARKPGGTGASAGGPPGMAGAPRAAATGAAGAGPGATGAAGAAGAGPGATGAAGAAGAGPGATGAAGASAAAPAGAPSGGSARGVMGGGAAITVEAVTLKPASIQTSIRLNGDVSAKSQISVYPDTSGKLVRYEASVGSRVNKGDVIAYVDPSKPGASYVASPVRAPIAGTVISLSQDSGGTVSVSTPIATVGALSDLEIVTYVPEKYVAVVHAGLQAWVSLAPYPDREFAATVSLVSPVVDAASRTIQVKLSVADAGDFVRPGMFAVIRLVTREASGAMVVPSSALKTYNGGTVAYVIDSEGKARRREVTVGLANDTSVQLLSGVAFGDRVVVSGSVTDGTPVRVAAPAGAAQ